MVRFSEHHFYVQNLHWILPGLGFFYLDFCRDSPEYSKIFAIFIPLFSTKPLIKNSMKKSVLVSLLLTIATAFSAMAQDHVTVYRDCQYRGSSHNLYEGQYLDRDLGVGNDAISAIRIPRGWKVTVYTNNRFQGASRTFDESVSCMPADLNDKISSMRVERHSGYQSSSASGGSGSGMITLYVDCNYRGGSHQLRPGTYNANQLGIGNDRLSAIRIPRGMKVTVYMDNNMRGSSLTFDKDVACMPSMYNDKVSSIRVESTHSGKNYNKNSNRNYNSQNQGLKVNFNARGKVPCKLERGAPTSNCDFGVVRRGGGDADVHIKTYNGLRIIYFQNGRAVGYDRSQGSGSFRSSKESDLYIIQIGNERYEIPEAVIYGG